jgi:predicted Rossmann fold flavoprotein
MIAVIMEADVAIVGAGAAGLAAGIFVRRSNPDVRVVVLDSARLPGAKIVISGGGRCNVTNAVVTDRDFWGGKRSIIRRVLRAFPVAETIEFFAGMGVRLKEEAGGKLFPMTDRSRDVSEALLRELQRSGASLLAGRRVTAVSRAREGFRLESAAGNVDAVRVVLATGGRSLPKTGSDGGGYALAQSLGHSMVPTTPALAPLTLAEASRPDLSGVSHDVELSIRIDGIIAERLEGSLLWTHYGVSGPVVLNASRHWERGVLEGRHTTVTANLLAGTSFEEAERQILAAAENRPKASLHRVLSDLLPASVAGVVVDAAGVSRELSISQLGREPRRRLTHALIEWPLAIVASRGYNYAEATAGGVTLDEIQASTMESRRCAGLVLIGEILDVDGRIGGFNFQWAWSSARAAARGLENSQP